MSDVGSSWEVCKDELDEKEGGEQCPIPNAEKRVTKPGYETCPHFFTFVDFSITIDLSAHVPLCPFFMQTSCELLIPSLM